MADLAAPITFERLIDVGVDDAFALFTEPERLRRWQVATAAVDLRVGGEYRFTVQPGSVAAGTYSEIVPGERLVYNWQWVDGGMPLPEESTLTVEFEPKGEQTLVRLTHAGLPSEEAAAGHTDGWEYYFERLGNAAATGSAGLNGRGTEGEIDDYDPLSAAEATWSVCSDVLSQLGPDDRERSTPCEGYTVHDLVEHLMESLRGLGSTVGVDVPHGIEAKHGEDYIAKAAEPVLAGWRARGLDGEVPFGEGTAPASMLAGILSMEFLVHAWDFAQAADLPLAVSPGLVGYVDTQARAIVQPQYRGSLEDGKGFAAETEASSDDPLTVLAAFTGRKT